MHYEEFVKDLTQMRVPINMDPASWQHRLSLSPEELAAMLPKLNYAHTLADRFMSYMSESKLDEVEVVEQLCRVVRTEGDWLRGAAMTILLRLRPSEALQEAVRLLGSEAADVRCDACGFLGMHPSMQEAESAIIDHLATESDSDVRCAAVNALCLVGSERSIPLLERIVANDSTTDYEGRPMSQIALRAINEVKSKPGG